MSTFYYRTVAGLYGSTDAVGSIPAGSVVLRVVAGGGTITSTDITDSTSVGRSVLTATDAAAARAAIGPITAADITDSTSVGRAVLTATDAAAARTAIGAAASGGSITAADITDSTSVGRSVLTATDAAAARAALGVSGVSASAIADLSGLMGAADAFHLIEPAGPFLDRGSAPQVLTETGAFRRARLGPRALIPAVWPPVSAVGSLSFPASIGYNGPFSVGLTIRGNGEAPAAGSILQATNGGHVRHEVFFSNPTNLNARIFSTSGPVLGGTPFAINTSISHRIVYTFAYPGGAVWMDGALGTAVFGWPNDPANLMLCLVNCAGISACDFDFWPGVVLTADQIAADFERYASSFRY